MVNSLESLFLLLFVIVIFSLGYLVVLLINQKKRIKHLEIVAQKENEALSESKEMLDELISINEESQKRIALELHDHLGASLNLTKSNIEHLKNELKEHLDNELFNVLQHTTSTLNEVVYRVRNISKNLQPDVLERQGLVGAINDFIQGIMLRRNIDIDFNFNTDVSHLTSQTELAIYRIIQEGVNNTVKYANAQNMSINLTLSGDLYTLILTDDGKGFDVENTLSKSKGIGLLNMQIRANQVNAALSFESKIGKGTTVKLSNHD